MARRAVPGVGGAMVLPLNVFTHVVLVEGQREGVIIASRLHEGVRYGVATGDARYGVRYEEDLVEGRDFVTNLELFGDPDAEGERAARDILGESVYLRVSRLGSALRVNLGAQGIAGYTGARVVAIDPVWDEGAWEGKLYNRFLRFTLYFPTHKLVQPGFRLVELQSQPDDWPRPTVGQVRF